MAFSPMEAYILPLKSVPVEAYNMPAADAESALCHYHTSLQH